MGIKIFFRTVFFLLTLFVIIYVAIQNTQRITFYFPLLLDKKGVEAEAPIIFFAIFAVGVFGGTLLNAGGGGKKGGGDSGRKK